MFDRINQFAATRSPYSWLASCLKIVNLTVTSETSNDVKLVTNQKKVNDH